MTDLHLAQDPQADALISSDFLALMIGMVLDQQITIEKAFRGPFDLSARIGHMPTAAEIASMDPHKMAEIFKGPPALHRYHGSMASRVQSFCQMIVDQYNSDCENIWKDVKSADELVKRVKALPGFGDSKAKIFVALLGKQLGVQPNKWQEVSKPFGDEDSHLSVADIVDAESLAIVRANKKAAKAGRK